MIYYDTTAIDAVNEGRDIPDGFYEPGRPSILMATRKYIATDGWRGYNTMTAEPGFKHIGEGTNCGGWSDTPAGTNETEVERDIKALEAKHGDVFIIWTPTSNVFATGYDALTRDPDYKPTREDRGKLIAKATRRWDLPDGSFRVRYHATTVIAYDAARGVYTLNTGGWATMTTAKRINEYLPRDRGYVYRKNWVMMLHTPDGDVELMDGMEV